MTDAEVLEYAARVLEHAATAATPGPWWRRRAPRAHVGVFAVKPAGEQRRYLDGREEHITVVTAPSWSTGRFVRVRSGRDLDWIVLMSPMVGLPLAVMLRDVSGYVAAFEKRNAAFAAAGQDMRVEYGAAERAAVELARALLESAPMPLLRAAGGSTGKAPAPPPKVPSRTL